MSHLSITAFCQACGSKHAFDPAVVGRRARCLTCGHTFVVPALSAASGTTEPPKGSVPAAKLPPSPPLPPGDVPVEVESGVELSPEEPVSLEGLIGMESAEPAAPAGVREEASGGGLNPLHELAHAETAPRRRVVRKEVGFEAPPVEVVREATVDPKAALTAMGVMQGMFYLALIAVVVVLLEMLIGVVLAVWVLLPVAVVYGKKIALRILFLLTGRATTG